VVKCGAGSICWKSADQPSVCRSTAEAEYIAAEEVAHDVQYVHALRQGMQLDQGCISIGTDNQAALLFVKDPACAA
jgi:hypothetical protein